MVATSGSRTTAPVKGCASDSEHPPLLKLVAAEEEPAAHGAVAGLTAAASVRQESREAVDLAVRDAEECPVEERQPRERGGQRLAAPRPAHRAQATRSAREESSRWTRPRSSGWRSAHVGGDRTSWWVSTSTWRKRFLFFYFFAKMAKAFSFVNCSGLAPYRYRILSEAWAPL